jgi:RNA polymerase sigma factor (sigma-70 family)
MIGEFQMAEDPITLWLEGLKEGDELGVERIVSRYFEPIVNLVRRRLPSSVRRITDEEDVALSALNSFIVRAQAGQFGKLENRNDLWKVLVTISLRKAGKYVKRESAQKRGGRDVRGESVFKETEGRGMEQVADDRPLPDEDVDSRECAESILAFLENLDDKKLRHIAVYKSEGLSDASIAEKLNCSTKTVQRKMHLLREEVRKWAQDAT